VTTKYKKRQKQTKKTEDEQHLPHIKPRKNSDVHTAHCSAVILRIMGKCRKNDTRFRGLLMEMNINVRKNPVNIG
jgi:hypothetical protein